MTEETRWMINRLPKRIKRAIRLPFAWFGILVAELVFVHVSHRVLLRICDFISTVYYHCDRRGRRQSLANLRSLTGKMSWTAFAKGGSDGAGLPPPSRRETIVIRRSYRNMARTIGHAFWTSKHAAERAAAVAELSPRCREWLAGNKPAITVSAHLGCWEVLSQLVFLEGHPMVSVAKDIGTHGMTRLLMKSRRSIGQEILPARGAFRPLMQALRDGKDIGLLVDQFVRKEDGGIWVWFLGRPMCVSVAPAFLAAKANAPTIVAWSRPLRNGCYRCEYLGTFPAAGRIDIRARTRDVLALLERVIRRHPSCWVLNYRYFNERPSREAFERELAETMPPFDVV